MFHEQDEALVSEAGAGGCPATAAWCEPVCTELGDGAAVKRHPDLRVTNRCIIVRTVIDYSHGQENRLASHAPFCGHRPGT